MAILVAFPVPVLVGLAVAVVMVVVGGLSVAVAARRRRRDDTDGWVMLSESAGSSRGYSETTWALAIGVAAAGVLAWLAAPGLYTKDAGELATAVHVLGVPHPTGFPLFCLFGKAFDLLPMGSVFFRINLLSAVAMGVAAGAAFLMVRRIEPGTARDPGSMVFLVAALLAPLGFLSSHTVWLHGTTTEVYGLSVAGLALTLLAWLSAWRLGDARIALVAAFMTGLGFGGHVTWPVLGSMAGAVVLISGIAGRRWSLLLAVPLVAASLLGLLVVLYLPIAALRDPVMNWGDPSTPASLWTHLSGERIRRSFEGTIGAMRWAAFQAHLELAIRVLWEGTGTLWPLAGAGLVLLVLGGGRVAAAVLGGILLADIVFAARINPMGVRDLQTMTSATLVLSVLAASGIAGLVRLAGSRKILVGIILCTGLLAVGIQASLAPADRDMRMVHAPQDVSRELLGRMPIGAALLTTTDHLSATIIALQAVEGARPDILALVRQHIGDTRYVKDRLDRHGGLNGEEAFRRALADMPFEGGGETPEQAVLRIVALLGERGPVFVEPGESRTDAPLRSRFEPGFPVFRVAEAESGDGVAAAVESARLAKTHLPGSDRWTRAWLAGKIDSLGTLLVMRGLAEPGRVLIADAVRTAPDEPRLLYNLAVMMMGEGLDRDAAALLRRAVLVDPAYGRAWRMLARAAASAGLTAEAEQASRKAEALSGGR